MLRRLNREFVRVQKEFEKNDRIDDVIVKLAPVMDTSGKMDISEWHATIVGPTKTPYDGFLFDLKLLFPDDYPYKPPDVVFKTKIWHPNISDKGIICMNRLKEDWVPRITVDRLLQMITSMMDVKVANAEDPLNTVAGLEMANSVDVFIEHAKDWCQKYARVDTKPTKSATKPTKKPKKIKPIKLTRQSPPQ